MSEKIDGWALSKPYYYTWVEFQIITTPHNKPFPREVEQKITGHLKQISVLKNEQPTIQDLVKVEFKPKGEFSDLDKQEYPNLVELSRKQAEWKYKR